MDADDEKKLIVHEQLVPSTIATRLIRRLNRRGRVPWPTVEEEDDSPNGRASLVHEAIPVSSSLLSPPANAGFKVVCNEVVNGKLQFAFGWEEKSDGRSKDEKSLPTVFPFSETGAGIENPALQQPVYPNVKIYFPNVVHEGSPSSCSREQYLAYIKGLVSSLKAFSEAETKKLEEEKKKIEKKPKKKELETKE